MKKPAAPTNLKRSGRLLSPIQLQFGVDVKKERRNRLFTFEITAIIYLVLRQIFVGKSQKQAPSLLLKQLPTPLLHQVVEVSPRFQVL